MAYTKHPQSSRNVFPPRQNTGNTPPKPRGVGQDKRALFSARKASAQPAPVTKGVRAQHTKPQRVRSQNRVIPPQRTTKVTGWVKPGVKAELEPIADKKGLSVSATGAAFLKEAVRQNLNVQHSVLLQPIIEQAI